VIHSKPFQMLCSQNTGSLAACISACPSNPQSVYTACVTECGARCQHALVSPRIVTTEHWCESRAWGWCGAGDCCPAGFSCTRRSKLAQCTPTPALLEAFAHSMPSKAAIEAFIANGTTIFARFGLPMFTQATDASLTPPVVKVAMPTSAIVNKAAFN